MRSIQDEVSSLNLVAPPATSEGLKDLNASA